MKLALLGDPVAHSKSPEIHRRFLREAEIEGDYISIRVPLANTINVIRRMRLDGYTGCNITTPLKEEALRACDQLDDEAARIGAINTIFFGNGKIYGTNTDGVGARTALESVLGEPVALHRIGIIGTGATARAILSQLGHTDAYAFVWGRDPKKVTDLCERFDAQPWPERAPEIIISCLPANIRFPDDLAAAARGAEIVMDVNYGKRSVLERALDREIVKGDVMLEAQARASFDFWLAHLERVLE